MFATRGSWHRSLVGARTLLGAPGLTTRNKKLLVTPLFATSSFLLLATSSDALVTRSDVGFACLKVYKILYDCICWCCLAYARSITDSVIPFIKFGI